MSVCKGHEYLGLHAGIWFVVCGLCFFLEVFLFVVCGLWFFLEVFLFVVCGLWFFLEVLLFVVCGFLGESSG